MNCRQRCVLKICAVIIGAMMLYPPYQIMGRGLGYDWIFSKGPYVGSTINTSLLVVQWLGVCLIGGIAYLLADGNSSSATDRRIQPARLLHLSIPVAIPLLRFVRGLVLVFFYIVALVFVSDLFQLTLSTKEEMDWGKVFALLLVKVVAIATILGLTLVVRGLINRLHARQTGANELLLPTWRSI